MSNQETDNETQKETDQKPGIEDLPVEDAAATKVKGGPIFLKIGEVDGGHH